MKLKNLTLGTALLFAGFISKAQSSAYIKGGINFANISVTNNGCVAAANQLTSFQVGIVGNVKLGTSFLYLQPGVLYTGKGSQVTRGTEGSPNYFKQTFNPFYVEVPVNLVVKAPLAKNIKFFAGAGPYLGIGVNGKVKTQGNNLLGQPYSIEHDIQYSNDNPTTLNQEEGAGLYLIRRFDYGLNGTAGIEGKTILLGLNYGLGLAKLQSGTNNNADNNDKNRVFSITLGFKF